MAYRSLRKQTLHFWARPHSGVPNGPVDSPAAWRGARLRDNRQWQVELDAADVDELHAAVEHAENCPRALADMTAADFPLPRLAGRIRQWRQQVQQGRGFVLLRGVPVADWRPRQAEIFFWCFGLHFGVPGAQNPQGDLLGHVRDQRLGESEDVRYYRTNKELAVHCDTADVVGLLCLQPAKSGGLSRIVSSVSVYNELLARKPHLVSRLFEPMYFDTKGEGGVPAFPVPPCRYFDGALRTFWQSDYFRTAEQFAHVPDLSPDEHELLDSYDGIANSPEFYLDMDLRPGDVQLLSNHTQLHARTGFEDWPDPQQRRHLLRLWMSLPREKTLRERWLTERERATLVATMLREMARNRLRAA